MSRRWITKDSTPGYCVTCYYYHYYYYYTYWFEYCLYNGLPVLSTMHLIDGAVNNKICMTLPEQPLIWTIATRCLQSLYPTPVSTPWAYLVSPKTMLPSTVGCSLERLYFADHPYPAPAQLVGLSTTLAYLLIL